jgi:uncharacterized protein YbjT (DUF2867 family)
MKQLSAVTGAFGYSGKYIARLLIEAGHDLVTLTGHPEKIPLEFNGKIRAAPFSFDQPARLSEQLRGVTTLFNTYWVRFDYGEVNFEKAVANSRILFQAAREAGVRRVVHISITNPALDSPLPYFRGKAEVETALRESGLGYAILRPTVLFGLEDILINNIAWLLRRSPFFAVPGSGEYRLQPVYVGDLARLAVETAGQTENLILDAVGPDVFTFNDLLKLIARKVGSRARILHLPPGLALWLSRIVGLVLGDVTLTRDEVAGLSADLLVSNGSPTCWTRLEDWLTINGAVVGRRYASELKRHYQRVYNLQKRSVER